MKILLQKSVPIDRPLDELKEIYNRDQKIEFTCEHCVKLSTKSLRLLKVPLLCRKCQIEQTAIKKYGSLEEMQKINLQHGKETSLQKYGKEHFTNREKCKQTKLDKYGNENYTNREKSEKTILEKYGVENPSKIDGVSDKVKQTKFKRYGDDKYNNIEQMKSTCLEKYGFENPGCIKATYIYDNEKFDSSWEICFWVYCKDNGKNIIRNKMFFEYVYDDKIHRYFPDFLVDDKLYEIKGDQFFNENNEMQNPFDHSQDELYEAKHQCGLRNNVTFLREADLKDVINYVNAKYGPNYLNQFLTR